MALSKSTITGRVPLPTDENLQFAELTFALSGVDTEGADVLPGGISTRIVLIDSDIPPGFELWQNMAGLHGTHYRVLARWTVKDRDGIRDQYADLGVIQIGSDPSYTLADLINNGVLPAVGTFWSAITQAQYEAVIQAADDAAASDASAAASAASAAASAASALDIAVSGSGREWPTTEAGIGQGIAGVTSIVAGSGGTDGTFALAFSGGTQELAPVGVFTVTGGALVSIVITYPGYYSAGTPTLSFAASGGLTGASAVAQMAANTPDNGYFSVPSILPDEAAIIYKNVAGVATEVVRTPSIVSVQTAISDLQVIQDGLVEYVGTDPVRPLILDASRNAILSVDTSDGALSGEGVGSAWFVKSLDAAWGAEGLGRYIGADPNIYPIVLDSACKVVLGINRSDGSLVGGGGGGSSSSYAAAELVALPAPISTVTHNHLLFYGQSLSVGANAGAVLSVAQPYSNVTFNGGPRAWTGAAWDFSALKPLVEDAVSPAPDGGTNRAETPCSGAANYASTLMAVDGVNPAAHIILASTAGHGGYTIAQLEKGSVWYSNVIAHVTGADALAGSYAVHALAWLQGENDAISVTTRAAYLADLTALRTDFQTDVQAITGQTSPVYLLTYQCSFSAAARADVALAQLDLAQSDDYVFLATPTYHLPHAADNVHLTAVGYKWIGAYFGRAYKALVDGVEPKWLNPVSATRRAAVIRVRFDVPQLPLVLDVSALAVTTDHGFKILDGASPATISSIAVDGVDVVITLSATPSGAVTVRYGLDYLGAGLTITNGGSGNLRDSTADVITISGSDRPLWHVCPAFELTAITLGE